MKKEEEGKSFSSKSMSIHVHPWLFFIGVHPRASAAHLFPRKKGDDPRFGAQVVAKSGDGVHRMAE
jgi:hypothetical protein